MKRLTLISILFTFISSTSVNGQDTIQWKDKGEKTFDLDFSDEKTFKEIKLTLTDVDSSPFLEIKFNVPNTNINFDTSIVESISHDTIIIDIKRYLQRAKQFESIYSIAKQTQLNVDINRANNEFMKFIYMIKPASAQVQKSKSKEFTPFPFPIFSYSFDQTSINKKHRILLIDGTPRNNLNRGFSLKKAEKKDITNTQLIDAKALVAEKSLSVYTKNISMRDLEYIRISVNGSDYTFNAGVSDLISLALGPEQDASDVQPSSTGFTNQAQKDPMIDEYFDIILSELKQINELTIEDFQTLQLYQAMLLDSIKGKRLDPSSLNKVSQILSYSPKYLNITSFPLTVPNNDEVKLSTEVKYKGGQPNSMSSGTFKTMGALSVNVGTAIFLTGLKNNNVYTKTLKVDNQPDELRAVMDEDNQLSVGIGVNSEVTYRTGSIFRPAINLGFFVPFDEEITPFFAIGPGLSIIDSKVSLNFSSGIAFGNINSISEKYKDVDLTNQGNLTNTDLIQKVWSTSWYVGIGVGFNINSQEK